MEILRLMVAAIFLISPFVTSADVIEFEISGFSEGAILSGFLSGEDSNSDNILDYSELTEFSLDWSGNSIAAAFSHGLANLNDTPTPAPFAFLFDILDLDLISFNSCDFISVSGCRRPTAYRGSGFGSFIVQGISDGPIDSSLAENAVYASVPEPGTLALLGIGLLGMGLARRRRTA